jgi:hypothetical protein
MVGQSLILMNDDALMRLWRGENRPWKERVKRQIGGDG